MAQADAWVHPNMTYSECNENEMRACKRWDYKYAKKHNYEYRDPRTPKGSSLEMSFMSWMSDIPPKMIDKERAEEAAERLKVLGVTKLPDPPNEKGKLGLSLPSKGGPLAHGERYTKALSTRITTPDLCPAYPSLSGRRMTPGSVTLKRVKNKRSHLFQPPPTGGGTPFTPDFHPKASLGPGRSSSIMGLEPPTARRKAEEDNERVAKHNELRALQKSLKLAIKRCSMKLNSKEAMTKEEREALQQLAIQQLDALKEVEAEMKFEGCVSMPSTARSQASQLTTARLTKYA